MLRKTRIILAALFFTGITLLFLGTGQQWWGFLAKVQFLPAVQRAIGGALLGNLAIVAGILLLTFIFGRVYCSVICPLGVMQDVVIRLRRTGAGIIDGLQKRRIRKAAAARAGATTPAEAAGRPVPKFRPHGKKFACSRERKLPRYLILALTVVAMICGAQVLVALIAPYSAYGRIVQGIVAAITGKSAAVRSAAAVGSTLVPALLVTAAATLLLVGASAYLWGRAWCNTVCPVGTLLGLVSRFSLFQLRFDTDKCTACKKCGRECKASCIDMAAHKVDASRCVACFDCIDNCPEGAISYRLRPFGSAATGTSAPAAPDSGRRAFITTAAIATAALSGLASLPLKAQEKKVDGGLAPLLPKQAPERKSPIVPPGAGSAKNFYDRCTACQLCVSGCPSGILRPSSDLAHLLQPHISYERGFCRPECTACSDLCPAGAILPVTREQKTSIRIGTAQVNPDLCLSALEKEACGNCVRHCPTGALQMVQTDDGRRLPAVSESECIGCGACEYLCPVRPVSAITVSGLQTHQTK